MSIDLDIIKYQYKCIDEAIDLFSQILSIEQICKYGFEFIVETLKIEEAAIYLLEDISYKLANKTANGNFIESELHTDKIDKIATLYGRTLFKNFDEYFSKELTNNLECEFIIPIIVKEKLCGFILINKIDEDYKDMVTLHFIETIRNMINISFYMALNNENDIKLKREIDKKIFNLFFINQSTKLLFSESNLEKLYQLCIDMIRELTSSSVTSFLLYDVGRDKMILKGFNDIINFQKFYLEIGVKNLEPSTTRTVFHIIDDRDILMDIFEDLNDFKKLSAEYIILLKNKKITGVATVGAPVNEISYDKQTLNQIESLSTSIYISIMNALYIEETNLQKLKIENQLNSIRNLNRIVKNINSCETLDEMMEIASETLEILYGVNKAAIFIRDENYEYELVKSIGFNSSKKIILDEGSKVKDIDEFYYDFEFSNSKEYIDEISLDNDELKMGNCVIISPIKLDIFELNGKGIFGYIIIWQSSIFLRSEELMCLDTLTNSMSPMVRQFLLQNEKMKTMSYDQQKLFVEKNDLMALNKERYQMNYKIYYKFIHCELFEEIDLSKYEHLEFYYFSCLLVHPIYDGKEVDESLFDGFIDSNLENPLKKLEELHKQFVEILAKF